MLPLLPLALGAAGACYASKWAGRLLGTKPSVGMLLLNPVPDSWDDLAHLSIAELVDYLARCNGTTLDAVLPEVPLESLGRLTPEQIDQIVRKHPSVSFRAAYLRAVAAAGCSPGELSREVLAEAVTLSRTRLALRLDERLLEGMLTRAVGTPATAAWAAPDLRAKSERQFARSVGAEAPVAS